MPAPRHWTAPLRSTLRRLGFDVVRYPPREPPPFPPDFTPEEIATIRDVEPFTLTGPERIRALIHAVEHVVAHQVPGAIAECGVWRGGSMRAVARTLVRLGRRDRDLFLFDTFSGMTPPGSEDVCFDGTTAAERLAALDRGDPRSDWCLAPLAEVRDTVLAGGYDPARIHFVTGEVEETIPRRAPERIALLRLDTDWYESTRHELVHLFPRLSSGGVLIVDDYGHWLGAKRATDEYVAGLATPLFLHRIDYTGRLAIKP